MSWAADEPAHKVKTSAPAPHLTSRSALMRSATFRGIVRSGICTVPWKGF
jgi:hypothetical protein